MSLLSSRLLVVAVTVCCATAVLSGCGDDDTAGDVVSSTTTAAVSSTTLPTTSEPTTTSADTSTTSSTSTSTPPIPDGPVFDDELPGTAFEIAPTADEPIAVIGVRFDDVLNVRRVPGEDAEIVATLDPLADDALATGRARQLTESIWWEVTTTDGIVGWVGSAFTAKIGPTYDATAAVIDELGYRPEEATMSDLGLLVGETIDRDPDFTSPPVMVVEADETGDLGEVTFDIVGLGDDAVRGIRLHVFGEPLPSGDGFGLRTVEQTDLCDPTRGPTGPDGLCA
jgi:hypothetical protein